MCRDPLLDVSAFNAQGGNVIIGTPGRLSDVMKRCESLDCKNLEVAFSPLEQLSFQTSFTQFCSLQPTVPQVDEWHQVVEAVRPASKQSRMENHSTLHLPSGQSSRRCRLMLECIGVIAQGEPTEYAC